MAAPLAEEDADEIPEIDPNIALDAEAAALAAEKKTEYELAMKKRMEGIIKDVDDSWLEADAEGNEQMELWTLCRGADLKTVIKTMDSNLDNIKLQRECCDVIGVFAMSTNVETLKELVGKRAAAKVVRAMETHADEMTLQMIAAVALARLQELPQKAVREETMKAGTIAPIVKAMDLFWRDHDMQKTGCKAISRIFRYLDPKPDAKDVAKAVLRAADPIHGENPDVIKRRAKKKIPEYKNLTPIEAVQVEASAAIRQFAIHGPVAYKEDLWYFIRGAEHAGADYVNEQFGVEPAEPEDSDEEEAGEKEGGGSGGEDEGEGGEQEGEDDDE